MAIIQSYGTVESFAPAWYKGIQRSSVRLYDQLNYDYATLYRVQPNVRVCVDFLARNIAQLGLHQFQRVSETDRVRLRDFGMTQLLKQPLPPKYKITRYRLIESMMSDLGIYFNSYHLKIRDSSGVVVGLLRIPPEYIYPEGGLVNTAYVLKVGSYSGSFDPSEVIHIRGYNPENPIFGLSPLETLRRILAEEDSSGKNREELWENGARMSGIIERPLESPDWSELARERFMSDFADLYGGEGQGGKTAILEDGMKWVSASFSPRESEYLGGRKLTREECGRSYHIPLPMIGILDNATFSNIAEQHKNLYQDSLGPWLVMIEQDLDLQLLPDFDGPGVDIGAIYTEFNILEKLQGSFDEQVKALQSAIGRPWMTADEGRARLNMPSLGGDAARLVTPLNVIVGGQASPTDSVPPEKSFKFQPLSKAFGSYNSRLVDQWQMRWASVLTAYYSRQERSVLSAVGPVIGTSETGKGELGSGVWWDSDRWNAELSEDLLKLNLATAMAFAGLVFDQTGVYADKPEALQPFEERLIPYLKEHSRIQAEKINGLTEEQMSTALNDPDPKAAIRSVFKTAITVRLLQQIVSAVTAALNFGSHEAALASSLASKTWRVNSQNPRDSHADLDGYTVGIRETFPNGLRWPGDPRGPADELAGCQCSVEFNR